MSTRSNGRRLRYTGIMVFCLVLGEVPAKRKLFVVDITEDIVTVSHLQSAIKKVKKPDLDHLAPNRLILWKVNIPIKDENKLKILDDTSRKIDIEQDLKGIELFPADRIPGDFSEQQPPSVKIIHIIVEQPTTTDQGRADILRDIATFGYLPRKGGRGGTLLPIDLRVRSTNEGININDPDISRRFDVIPPLIKDLIDRNIILVRAPPFSGKTSTAQILEHTLINASEFSNYRVIRISLLWKTDISWDTFGERWKNIVGVSWKEWMDQCDLIPTILIVDEAQFIYSKEKKVDKNNIESADQFWITVKAVLQEVANIKIIMFAAYGYRSSNHIGLSTPVALPESNCKSLVDINFTHDELKKYVEKFSGSYFKSLDTLCVSKLYKYIQVVTEGHAGLARHILSSIENAMKKRIDTSCLTWEEIFKYLNSESFNKSIYDNCRAVPRVSALSTGQIKICEEVYLKGKIRYIDSNKDAVDLVKYGILIVDDIYITFAAPLLKRSFFQQHYRVINDDVTTPTDLHHFIVKIFIAMCNELSGKILRETLGFGSDGRILEQTWQKEFYRIGTQVLGKDHFLSCDVGSVFGCDGKIDFYVDKLDWAIELLRDGEDMTEHRGRFEPMEGVYKEIGKYAKSIAIIDIRSEAKKVQKLREDFIHVSCSEDYDAFKIESLGKETVTIRFQN